MPRSLKLYIAIVVAVGVLTLAVATFVFPADPRVAIRIWTGSHSPPQGLEIFLGIAFWISITVLASALPVQMPRGTQHAVSIAPIVAAIVLGGPAVGGIVAALGTTEMREIRGRIPWYGTLANHAGLSIPAVTAGVVRVTLLGSSRELVLDFVTAMLAAVAFYVLNATLAGTLVSLRTGQPLAAVLLGDSRGTAVHNLALAPLAWLMSVIYAIAWWATLLFALPLYTTRLAYQKFIEMREMFTQTIGALAEAVDKRDPFTSRHSQNVKTIAVDIGRVMRVSDAELEALEWGGLLHDVGKIGVPDAVLLKQERLTREERMIMNAHPVLGAEIIAPVAKLAPELPIIRHHHEWYNGSGYPDRLMGDEIPRLARVLHVADAFEAMTAARPYRMTPLTAEQALGELRKFAGIQFDPQVVDAFVRTSHADGVPDPGRHPEPRPIPMLAQAATRMSVAQPDMGPGAQELSPTGPVAAVPADAPPVGSAPTGTQAGRA
jgi:putative nucleotidyltransferase with HDIG domain